MLRYLLLMILKITSIFIILGVLVIYIYLESRPVDFNNMREDMSGLAYVFLVAAGLINAVICLSALLNLFKVIRQNYLYSFASFFGLHFTVILFQLLITPPSLWMEMIPFTLLYGPYLSMLFYHFVKFRKRYVVVEG